MTKTPAAPREAIVAVNYRCNARCRMCDIWRLKEDGALTADDYRRLPARLNSVSVTGGEPFIRRDVVSIVRAIAETCGNPQIIINTNGYLTERILADFRELRSVRPAVGVGISLDGLGAVHDKIRGTPNAFGKVLRTIHALKAEGVKNIRISHTATAENVADIVKVYELSRRLGIQFASVSAQNSDHYFHTDANDRIDAPLLRQAYEIVNQRELASASVKRWLRAYYNSGIVLFNEQQRRLVPCTAASDFFFLSPRGDVYPCLVLTSVLGNLRETAFEDLWNSVRAAEARDEVRGCERCWMMCSSRTVLKKRALAAAAWVIKQQLNRYVGAVGLRPPFQPF